ncbi:MAG: ComF family protein [Deltaproteobacteria bacterium]|nr:ComF family protein [Deltaproteobacteria bacterium]
MDTAANNLTGSFLNLFFPPVCPLCKKALSAGHAGLCATCLGGLKKIDGPLCTVCGTPFPFAATGPEGEAENRWTCAACLTDRVPFVRARSAFYYEGVMLEAIHGFKYGGDMALAAPLGRLMAGAALKVFPAGEMPELIVPVPLHCKRLKTRGFNQSLLIAGEMAKTLSIEVDRLSLKRTRHTAPQVEMKEKERLENVKGAFEVTDLRWSISRPLWSISRPRRPTSRPCRFSGKRVLLVDDVFTTGATVRECSKALKKAGAEVYVLTLARVVRL